jgi:hypothetical protein
MAFLTLEDPNIEIKGSRDPLGAQPIWAKFARNVIVNLTTQTNSIRGFTVLLLGRYFAERLIEENVVPREEALNVFLRMEQVGGYVRLAGCGTKEAIRGIDRVRRYLDDRDGKPAIGVTQKEFILSDQKVYGLWGLYSVSARTSGLLPEGAVGVTATARDFIEKNYGPALNSAAKAIRRLLAEGGVLDTKSGKDPVFGALCRVLPDRFSAAEREFYGKRIRDGVTEPEIHDRQVRLRSLVERLGRLDQPASREDLAELRKLASRSDTDLEAKLDRILKLEAILAPAAALFDFILARNGKAIAGLAADLRQRWGKRVPNLDQAAYLAIMGEVREASSKEIEGAIAACYAAMAEGDFEAAIKATLDWNKQVMARRGGGPWAIQNARGVLDVRMAVPETRLPEKSELGSLWRNDYFISSLRRVTRQLAA